ncbi:hypothetical protein DRX19_23020 [Salmonella enterica subsp. enterica]|nr:hypothetical protein [Salmonella enterica subsp. enterica serovar Pensacola]
MIDSDAILHQVHFINEHTGEVVDKQLRSKDFLTFFNCVFWPGVNGHSPFMTKGNAGNTVKGNGRNAARMACDLAHPAGTESTALDR